VTLKLHVFFHEHAAQELYCDVVSVMFSFMSMQLRSCIVTLKLHVSFMSMRLRSCIVTFFC
jgi:hypothetical protein